MVFSIRLMHYSPWSPRLNVLSILIENAKNWNTSIPSEVQTQQFMVAHPLWNCYIFHISVNSVMHLHLNWDSFILQIDPVFKKIKQVPSPPCKLEMILGLPKGTQMVGHWDTYSIQACPMNEIHLNYVSLPQAQNNIFLHLWIFWHSSLFAINKHPPSWQIITKYHLPHSFVS